MDTEADATPSRVGRYDIVLPLAVGRTATVYLARPRTSDGRMDSSSLGTDEPYFALKLITRGASSDPTAKRLLGALRDRRHLRHLNVIPIVDIGDSENGAFALMEYVPGETLAGLRRLSLERDTSAELPRGVALKILVDALAGLHAVHELTDAAGRRLNLVHRGFSAQKILVGTDGIARLCDFASSSSAAIAPPAPAAPELGDPDADVDGRADVWAAATVAWEILTSRPFEAEGATSGVSGELDALLGRALHRERDERPSSALAFAKELESVARDAGLFAHASEVVEHVLRLVGPELVERKGLLAEARRQQKRPASAPDVRTMIGMAGPPSLKRAPLPSLPDLPPSPNDLTSELRIEVNLAGPVERAALDVLGPASAPVMEEPEVFRSPVAVLDDGVVAAGGTDEPKLPSSPRISAVSDDPKGSGLGAIGSPFFSPPWTTKKTSILAGVGGSVIGFILVLVVVSGRAKPDPQVALLSSSAAAALSTSKPAARNAAPPAASSAKTTVDLAPPAAAAAPAAPAVLLIKANGPIASVTVDGRAVDAVVATSTLTVDLEDGELGHPLKVTAKGTDGRIASATAESGARELQLSFASKARPRTGAPPATTTKRPWSKRSH